MSHLFIKCTIKLILMVVVLLLGFKIKGVLHRSELVVASLWVIQRNDHHQVPSRLKELPKILALLPIIYSHNTIKIQNQKLIYISPIIIWVNNQHLTKIQCMIHKNKYLRHLDRLLLLIVNMILIGLYRNLKLRL
jgi:hypothetical protein